MVRLLHGTPFQEKLEVIPEGKFHQHTICLFTVLSLGFFGIFRLGVGGILLRPPLLRFLILDFYLLVSGHLVKTSTFYNADRFTPFALH